MPARWQLTRRHCAGRATASPRGGRAGSDAKTPTAARRSSDQVAAGTCRWPCRPRRARTAASASPRPRTADRRRPAASDSRQALGPKRCSQRRARALGLLVRHVLVGALGAVAHPPGDGAAERVAGGGHAAIAGQNMSGIELDQPEHRRLRAERHSVADDEGDEEDRASGRTRQRQRREQPSRARLPSRRLSTAPDRRGCETIGAFRRAAILAASFFSTTLPAPCTSATSRWRTTCSSRRWQASPTGRSASCASASAPGYAVSEMVTSRTRPVDER